MCKAWLGLVCTSAPKHIEVRFRSVNTQAHWLETNDRGLYLFISELAEKVRNNTHKKVTEAESTLLELYLGNYFTFRLNVKFICDFSDFIIKFMNMFESRTVMIHRRFMILIEFFYSLYAKILKNAGLPNDDSNVTADVLLNIDYKNPALHLDRVDLFLGLKVDAYLKEAGLTRLSPEIKDWICSVKDLYLEVIEKAIKYLSTSLKSKTLQYMKIVSPKHILATSLEDLKVQFKYVGKRFHNIVSRLELPEMLDELVILKAQPTLAEMVDCSPEEFMFKLSNNADEKYKTIARLGQAIADNLLKLFGSGEGL